MNNAITLQSSLRTSAPRLAEPIGRAVARLATLIEAWSRPPVQSASQAAAELRILARQYHSHPAVAADLRAAADRHEHLNGID